MKQNMKKVVCMAMIGALAATSAPMNSTVSQAAAKTKKIVMNKKKVTLKVGKTFKLKVKKVKPAKASKAVTYKSNKKKIATVSKKGKITAKKVGTAKITVTSKKNKKAKAVVKVTVKKNTVTGVAPTTAPSSSPATVSGTPAPTAPAASTVKPTDVPKVTDAPATDAPATDAPATKKPSSTQKPPKTPAPTKTPTIIDLDEYEFDIKDELWTNEWYERKDNADGSITLTRGKGEADWQVGEFGFVIPRDKVGDLHEFTRIVIKYRDSDLTDGTDESKCGYVFHMGDDTEVGWIESEDGGHPKTLDFNGSGEAVIEAGETKSGESESNFSTVRIFDGKLGGKITIESVKLEKGTKTPGVETGDVETGSVETGSVDTGAAETPKPSETPDQPVEDDRIIDIDITKDITVAGWGKTAAYDVQDDGSVKITWAGDTSDYTFCKFNFDAMDLTGYWCVIDAEGDNLNVEIHDKTKKETKYDNPYSVILPQYGQSFPWKMQLTPDKLNTDEVKGGGTADYTNVGGINIFKGAGSTPVTLTVKSIKFYKNEEDIPKA